MDKEKETLKAFVSKRFTSTLSSTEGRNLASAEVLGWTGVNTVWPYNSDNADL